MISPKTIAAYRALGGNLFPVESRGKRPLFVNWQGEVYSDKGLTKLIQKRNTNLGWAIPDHVIVIDIDPRNGGQLETITSYGIKPNVKTGGDGYHFYIKLPPQIPSIEIKSQWEGIDIKRKGGYVVTAESETTGKYKARNLELQKCPKKLLRKLLTRKRTLTKANGRATKNIITSKTLARLLGKLPIKAYSTNDLWYPILAASHNATNGKGLNEFLAWSLSDPKYRHDKDTIKARWHSLKSKDNVITVRTLLKEVEKHSDISDLKIESNESAKKDFDDKVKARRKVDDISYTVAINVLKNHYGQGRYLKHCNDLRYWFYNGRYWQPTQINVVEQALYNETVRLRMLKPSAGKRGITVVFKQAETILRALCAVPGGLYNGTTTGVINCQNGELWIDAETGKAELKPHNPESNLTYMIDCEYNPEKKCKRFDRALLEIFEKDEKTIRHLWEVIGYTIQPKKNLASWVLFHGRGSNGKTVLLNVLSALLGDSVLEKAINDLDTAKNNHALADLPGKLAVIDEDLSATIILPDSLIKKISENKMLTANPKNAQTFRFQSIAIPILAGNSWPKTVDLSEGLRRRALVFPFKRQFMPAEQDLNLAERIVKKELSGVLNKAIVGLMRLRQRNQWKPSPECEIAKRIWFNTNNQIGQFISDNLTEGKPESFVTMSAIWKRYIVWCYENGIRMHMARYRLQDELGQSGLEVVKFRNRTGVKRYMLA